jgi:branched-chain amino acid transport system substrate-binding protein
MRMRSPVFFTNPAILALLTALTVPSASGQTQGVTNDSILIGSCSALDGPARFLGNQTVLGASAYLHSINDHGGVYGRKINLMAFDDGYDPEKAPECFKRMMKEGVFALGFFVGTPTAAKYLPLAQEERVPVVGLFTGAQLLYEPLKHYIINVRASYYDETHEQVSKLWEVLNIRKIGVIYQDDAFGKAVLDGVKLALEKHHALPSASALSRETPRTSSPA